MSKRFDAVIVGGRLSAVITAALLGKRGLRCLLVDQGELASSGSGDLNNDLISPETSQVVDVVHRELEVLDTLYRASRWVEPSLQLVFNQARFEVSRDRAPLIRHMDRQFGPGAESLLRVFDDSSEEIAQFLSEVPELPPTARFFARRSASSVARKAPTLTTAWDDVPDLARLPEACRELVRGLAPFLTHLDPRSGDASWLGRWSRPLARFMSGVARIDDARGLRGVFLTLAQNKALELRESGVEQVEASGKSWSITIAGAREPVFADILIDASTDLSGVDAMPSRRQGRQLAVTLQAARPRGQLYELGLEVARSALPPCIGPRLLLLNGRRDPERFDPSVPDSEDRPILLEVLSAAEPHRVRLLARYPVSAAMAHSGGERGGLDRHIRARVDRLFPFFAQGSPATYRPESDDLRPAPLLHPHFDPTADAITGLGGVPVRTPFKNLFLAGPAVLPGLGQEGEYMAALQAADAASTLHSGAKHHRGSLLTRV